MIPTSCSVIGVRTRSDGSLSRTLSTVDRLRSQSSHASPRLPHHRSWKFLPHLLTCRFLARIPHRKLQKPIHYPETRSGSVQ